MAKYFVCPHCGHAKCQVDFLSEKRYAVECECGARGPIKETREEAEHAFMRHSFDAAATINELEIAQRANREA